MAKTKKEKSIQQIFDEAFVKENEWPYGIPDNWVWVKLGAINFRKSASVDPRKYPTDTFELYSVPSFVTNFPEISKGNEIKSGKQLVQQGDLLLCKINPRINRVWIVANHTDFDKIASSEWIVISLPETISKDYLMWLLQVNYFRNLLTSNVSGVGGSLTRARPADVASYPIPLPPLEEQKRIVKKLSSMLDKLKEARELIQEAKDSFENRHAAILNKAIMGKLTKKWREENPDVKSVEKHLHGSFLSTKTIYEKRCAECKLKGERKPKKPEILNYYNKAKIKRISKDGLKGWCETNFVNFCILQRGFDLPKKQRSKGKYPVVSSSGVIDRHFEYKVKGPGITVGRSGSVGKTFYIEDDYWPLNTTLFAKETNGNDPKFIYYNFLLFNFAEYSSSTAVPTLNRNNFSEAVIRIPPLEEQKEIVRLLDKIFDIEDKSKELIKLEEHINLLEKSILSKAFRGELDTNDPKDESATKLLEKTFQSRKLTPIKPKTRKFKATIAAEIKTSDISLSILKLSENALILLKEIKQYFGENRFNAEKLKDKSKLYYEDFKEALFELLKSKLNMTFNENKEVITYQLKK